MIVGLTGGIGSGKTTIAYIFKEFKNVGVYIADIEAKKLMNSSLEIKEKLITTFGQESYLNDALNRKFIANLVFKDKEKLKILNNIVHPVVKQHFKEYIVSNKNKDYIVYENAILFESKSNLFCEKIISVSVPLAIRIERVMVRDNVSEESVLDRINNQWKEDKKTLQSNYIIENSSLKRAKNKVREIHNILTKK